MPLNGKTNFNRRRALTHHRRAYFKVRLFGSSGNASSRAVAQLDTGADYTILPVVLARQLGYQPNNLQQQSVQLANGSTATFWLLRQVSLGVDGHRSQPLDVLLAPAGSPILLAARDLLKVTEFGLDPTDVHFD